MKAISNLLHVWRNDHGLRLTMINRIFSLLSNGTSILLIGTQFDSETQGWYYYLLGLLGIQSVLELGFNSVVIQFLSHEYALFNLHKPNSFKSIMKWSFFWNLGLGILFYLVAVIGVGHVLATHQDYTSDKENLWQLLVILTSLSFLLNPWKSALDACNQIHKSQRIYLISGTISNMGLWWGIVHHHGLKSLVISMSINLILQGVFFFKVVNPMLVSLSAAQGPFFEIKRFFQQQAKIATSFLFGYFSSQTLIPLVFSFMGPVAAGRVGMSMQIYQALLSLGAVWSFPKIPLFSKYYVNGQIQNFTQLVESGCKISSWLTLLFGVMALIFIQFLNYLGFDRFAPFWCNLMIVLTALVQQHSMIYSSSIRFMKKEPFVAASAASALLITLNNYATSKLNNLELLYSLQFLILYITSKIWVYSIYRTEIRMWNSKND